MKHENLVSQMTLKEKAALLSGKTVWETQDIPRLNLPSIFCSDGPHGIRKQAGSGDHLGLNESLPSTCFPSLATVANSWDEELGYEIGAALGREARELEVHALLGPGLNIKRNPLCGRNFEYFSEDPYLSGKLASAYIKGIQSEGVYACPKHFAVNSQEHRRMAMNSVIDERTLRELYLTGFEIAVKEGDAKTIMSSYNEVNGVYANENKHLLQEILRKEWGFDGIIISDWGASNDHVSGVAARATLEMPAPGLASAREIIDAVESGKLSIHDVDVCVDDLVDAVITLTAKKNKPAVDYIEHDNIARRAAQQSAVLLKNTDEILPLSAGTKVAVIGDFAITPRYQGAGSSMVNPRHIESVKEVIKNYPLDTIGIAQGYLRTGEENAALLQEALKLAAEADVVLYCFGLDEISESEGMDRSHMRIPQNQIDLLESIYKVNPNIVGILSAGAAVEMPWDDKLKGLLHCYLYGQTGASAMLNVVTGKINPSGRLNESYPIRYEDCPSSGNFPSSGRNSEYREGIYVGYRYYDTNSVRVQYPFGFGLSYTSFEYSDLTVTKKGITLNVTNTGKCDGSDVVQMYIGLPGARVFRPRKELKGFKKLFIPKGESKRVEIPFDEYSLRYWNVKTNSWEIEEGGYIISVGSSVADIKLEDTIYIEGTKAPLPYNKNELESYYSGRVQKVNDSEFETLLAYKIPEEKMSGDLQVNDPICQMQYAKSFIARFVYRRLTSMKNKSEAKGNPDLNILFVYNMPFRAIAKMTSAIVDMNMVRGLLMVTNGHFFRGIGKFITGFFRNKLANRRYKKDLSEQ